LVAGDEGDDGGNFLGLLEAFQERTGAHLFKEFLFQLRGGSLLLTDE
jgi:hypothetical protein